MVVVSSLISCDGMACLVFLFGGNKTGGFASGGSAGKVQCLKLVGSGHTTLTHLAGAPHASW